LWRFLKILKNQLEIAPSCLQFKLNSSLCQALAS
jgi:hypothetical protein